MWKNAALILFCLLALSNSLIFWVWLPLVEYKGWVHANPEYRDALSIAMETGRLDAISLLLTILGVLLAVLALVGFGYVRYRAETIAKVTADIVARDVTEEYFKRRGLEESRRTNTSFPALNVGDVDITDIEPEVNGNGDA